jgi:hypothetical protein
LTVPGGNFPAFAVSTPSVMMLSLASAFASATFLALAFLVAAFLVVLVAILFAPRVQGLLFPI